MNVTINTKEVAEAIAMQVAQSTGFDCEAFTNDTGAVIVYRSRTVIARITELFHIIDVAASSSPSNVNDTEIPTETRTIDGLREIARALDEAIVNVTRAATDL